jgi:hypothetical protein
MPSSASYPICRIDWRPDPLVSLGLPVLAALAIYAIFVSGLSSGLQGALISGTTLYAWVSYRRYAGQSVIQLESTACGALWVSGQDHRQRLEGPVWRDWGYLVELSGRSNGNKRTWFWLVARTDSASLRQLRLLSKAHDKKAAAAMPSIITNPVL